MGEILQLDRRDFESIYESYYDRVYKYVYTILLNKEDAEDVTAETFLSAYTNFDRYDAQKASVSTWLTRIAHNHAVNIVRSAAYRKRTEMPEHWEAASDGDFTEEVMASEMMVRLYRELSPEEREFLNMRYVMEMKDKEIAELLGMQEKAVNKRYQRLLARCREMLSSVSGAAE